MQTILVALGCLVALFVGAVVGRAPTCEPWLASVVVGVLALTLAAWLVALVSPEPRRSRASSAMVIVALLGFALVRGASVGAVEREHTLVRAERAWAAAGPEVLRELEVVGASEPGPRCSVWVREPERADAASFELELVASACPLAQGDRFALRGRELESASARLPSWRAARQAADEHPPLPRPSRADARLARYHHAVAQLRQRAWEASRGDRAASLSAAIGLGLRATLDAEDREALRGSGLGHLIAVSGLQVALAGLWLQVLVRRVAVLLGISARWTCVVTWLPLLAYVSLTGAAPPALRSAAMLIAVDLGTIVGRPSHGPTLLACVAALLGVVEPAWLFDPGYQLSVAAMAAIVTAPPGQGVLASSWRITWATAPLSIVHFDVAPLHALLGNLIALPLFSLLMPAALLGWALHGTLGELALAPARVFALPILDAAELFARVPGADARLLAALALLGLLGHRVRARRGAELTELAEPLAPSNVLPPKLACVAVLLVAVPLALGWPGRSPLDGLARERFEWLAIGTPRSQGLLIRDRRAGRLAPQVCVIRPMLGAGETERLLDELGVVAIPTLVASEREANETRDARTALLALELRRSGVVVGDEPLAGHCVLPDPELVRASLRACQAWHGGRGRVLVLVGPLGRRCWVEGRWVRG